MFDKHNSIAHRQPKSNKEFVDYYADQKTERDSLSFLFRKKRRKEQTVSTSNANIRLEDVTGLHEDFICLKLLNSL